MTVSVQLLSCVRLFGTPWTAARQASLSISNCRNPPKLMSIESVMPSNHLIPLSSPYPSALNLSQHQGLFKWVWILLDYLKECFSALASTNFSLICTILLLFSVLILLLILCCHPFLCVSSLLILSAYNKLLMADLFFPFRSMETYSSQFPLGLDEATELVLDENVSGSKNTHLWDFPIFVFLPWRPRRPCFGMVKTQEEASSIPESQHRGAIWRGYPTYR